MKTLKELYADLEKYKDFGEDENAENFLGTVDEIISKKDPACIRILMGYFDDESEFSWVLEELSGSIECLDKNKYITELLKNLDFFIMKTKIWSSGAFFSIFNAPEYLSIFRTNMHLAPKSSLLELFSIMEEESPHHHELIQELRKELEKS